MTNQEMDGLISDVSFVVHDLTRTAFAKIDEYLREFGLVRTHASILRLLKISSEMSMTDLSDKLQVTKQNITQLIDKLEKLGYVERSRASNDRRIILIRLSSAGEEFVDNYVKKFYNYFSKLFSKLEPEDLNQFQSDISSLKQILSKLKED
ncbi:MAG: MarR family transcriptional regulator [Intestinimonas sp.]|nr:MarR family transcriptional regulator [Intestinimonas sp.]